MLWKTFFKNLICGCYKIGRGERQMQKQKTKNKPQQKKTKAQSKKSLESQF